MVYLPNQINIPWKQIKNCKYQTKFYLLLNWFGNGIDKHIDKNFLYISFSVEKGKMVTVLL